MRDHLIFYVNGIRQEVRQEAAFCPLSSYLRYSLGQTGTKVVCAEGDCGACSVIVGYPAGANLSYKPINSCIQYLYQLDGCHIITVEGLKYEQSLNPVQQAMVNCHGAQCGYCTPGFITTLCHYFDQKPATAASDSSTSYSPIKNALIGNLCRCTGYSPIIEAALAVDTSTLKDLAELYPAKQMLAELQQVRQTSVLLTNSKHMIFCPASLAEALQFKEEHPEAVVISGGTDVCVNMNKRDYSPDKLLSLGKISELAGLELNGNKILVGARTTLSELEQFCQDKIPQLGKILWLFGSPQIRNAGTLVGNIANASPIADLPPFLFVMEAQINVASKQANRSIAINDFYQGYKKLALSPDELITGISIPLPAENEIIKLYKVSKRINLDISSFTAAFRLTLENGIIRNIRIAFGGVGPTILRLPDTENFLTGKQFSLASMVKAAALAEEEISPISDVRGSKDFRLQLGRNIFQKLYHEQVLGQEALCPL